jgi:mono/diheme cytochrome c family protein
MSNCRNGFKIFFLLFAFATILPFKVLAYDLPVSFDDLSDADVKARVDEGKKLFKANCAACHKVEGKLTGPALADVWTRWDSQEKLIKWVHNSQELIKSGDAYANKLFNDNNKQVMSSFTQLSEDQVINIIDYYVQAEQKGLLKVKAAGDAGGATATDAAPAAGPNKWVLFTVIAALVLIAISLISITSKLDGLVHQTADGETVKQESLLSKFQYKKFLSILIIIGVLFLGYSIVKGAIDLGRSQGYEPDQPIKFSHALHAGQNKIDCQYCHTGADKGRHAVIPSMAVCMNCHKYVQQGPKYGETEIAKIYEYSGWDPTSSTFKNAPKPIQWVKIHNLPDHVYFNHSQHVKVGGIACQTCHGNVQEMEVVKQFAPLSMGWCINCHRQTDVQFANNDYYSIFEKYHDEIKKGERSNVTVADIGGTECSKCHY